MSDLDDIDADLDPGLRALYRAEAKLSDMPEGAPAAILAKVHAGLAASLGAAAGHGGPPGHAAAGPSASLARTGVTAALKQGAVWAAFAVGAAAGAAGHAALERGGPSRPSPPPSPSAVAPSADPAPAFASAFAPRVSIPTAPVDASLPSASSVEPPRAAHPPARPRETPPLDDASLAEERALLEVARTGLARGQGAAALASLRADAERHPRSRLAEERESLTIQALVVTGQPSLARSRAAAFARSYPQSLFLPVVRAAVARSDGGGL